MSINFSSASRSTPHPVHAALVAGALPLFAGALLSDAAYASTYQVQWANFSSWLIAGALILAGLALLWALIGLSRPAQRRGRALIHPLLLLAAWILGFINALVHARDAWATMPTGLSLSIVVSVIAFLATWTVFSGPRSGETK